MLLSVAINNITPNTNYGAYVKILIFSTNVIHVRYSNQLIVLCKLRIQ